MILLGPIIGCIRNDVVTIGYEVSIASSISIEIKDHEGHIVFFNIGNTIPNRFKCVDVTLSRSESYTMIIKSSYNTGDSIIEDIKRGSFRMGYKVAVVSCNNLTLGSPIMWNHLSKSNISTCLHIGDNIYNDYGSDIFARAMKETERYDDLSDIWENIVDVFRQGYRTLWSTPHMKNILSTQSNIFIWDDHDVCDSWNQDLILPTGWEKNRDNNGNIQWDIVAKSVGMRQKVMIAAIQAYCEYQLPLSLGMKVSHILGSFTYDIAGKRILFVDRRMHLISKCSGRTPLIPVTSSIKPDIVVTGVPIFYLHPWISNNTIDWFMKTFGSIKDLHDHWLLFPNDLESVLSILHEKTLLLSGDVHMCGDTYIKIAYKNNTFTCRQVTSSAISSPAPPKILLWFLQFLHTFETQVGSYKCKVDHKSWSRDNGYVTFDIRNHEGTIEYILSSLLK